MANWIERLHSGEPVVGEIVDSLEPEAITDIATDPGLDWEVLAEQPERDAAILLFEYRMQALVDVGDFIIALRDLEDPVLLRDAATDIRLESLAIRVAMGLVFFDPVRAEGLCRSFWAAHSPNWRFDIQLLSRGPDGQAERYRERTELLGLYLRYRRVSEFAPQWRALRDRVAIPRPLERFIAVQWVASRFLLDELLADLHRDMSKRSGTYLEVFDAVAVNHRELLNFIIRLSERFSREAPLSPGDLDEEEREKLVSAIEEIAEPIARGGVTRLLPGLLSAAAVGALLSLAGHDTVAVGAMGLLGGAVAIQSMRVDRGQYARVVRPRLAAYLAKVGTPIRCITSCLGQNRETFKKLEAFNPVIHRDQALEVIARLGRMTELDRDVAL